MDSTLGIGTTHIPENLREHIPFLPKTVQFYGQGNNAVVLRDPEGGDVVKLYGHNNLLSDPHVQIRIQRHFASEIIALNKLSSAGDGLTPYMTGNGRIHPSEPVYGWLLNEVHGWIRMSYLDGIRQDKIAIRVLNQGFTDEQRNDRFYYSVGKILGRLHRHTEDIDHSAIQHNIYDNDLARAQLYEEKLRAQWEVSNTRQQASEKGEALTQALTAYGESYRQIVKFKGDFRFNHGDFAARNMLYRNEEGQITASSVIDFGEAGIALPEQDFQIMGLGLRRAAIEGYESTGCKFSPERHAEAQRHTNLMNNLIELGRT